MGRAPSPIFTREAQAALVKPVKGRGGKVIAFGWYGGKFSHLNWLLPECHHYCEPYAGSAAVLLNRPAAPVETYNDIDGEVVNFFRVLREQPDELTRAIGLTPFSREECFLAVSTAETAGISAFERARRFFYASGRPGPQGYRI